MKSAANIPSMRVQDSSTVTKKDPDSGNKESRSSFSMDDNEIKLADDEETILSKAQEIKEFQQLDKSQYSEFQMRRGDTEVKDTSFPDETTELVDSFMVRKVQAAINQPMVDRKALVGVFRSVFPTYSETTSEQVCTLFFTNTI
jgi:hypothetical protein